MQTLVDCLVGARNITDFGLRFVDRKENAEHIPWSRISEDAARTAGQLLALGCQPGDRICLVYPTEPGFFSAFLGAVWAGIVPVPLYPPVRLGRLDEYAEKTSAMIQITGARAVLASPRVRRLLGPAIQAASPEFGCLTLEDLPAAPEAPRHQASLEDLAFVQFSSGTTAAPKAVALSHGAVMAQASILVNGLLEAWPEKEHGLQSGISWLPLYHDMGLIGCVFPALLKGRDLTLLGPEVFVTRPALWLRSISRYKCTISTAPNFAYGMCVHKIKDADLEGVDLSTWQVALNGAESISAETLEAFSERFSQWGFNPKALTPVYGLSEAALAVTFSSLKEGWKQRTHPTKNRPIMSLGPPLPGFKLEIRSPDNNVLPEERVGHVWVQGPSLMQGYLQNPEATDKVLQDGWLDTGDLGFLQEGELHVVGRAKEVLILRGRNTPPEAVESAVAEIAGLRRGCAAAVCHRPPGAHTDELVLLVEQAKGLNLDSVQLARDCREAVVASTGLLCWKVEVLEPGTLPRTSSGKIRRIEAEQRFAAGTLEAAPEPGPLGLATALVRSSLAMPKRGG